MGAAYVKVTIVRALLFRSHNINKVFLLCTFEKNQALPTFIFIILPLLSPLAVSFVACIPSLHVVKALVLTMHSVYARSLPALVMCHYVALDNGITVV